jgi:3-hydroxy-9,10-secoandrosta-1,3,5(10)-triene-9,17-dione monooxygenase
MVATADHIQQVEPAASVQHVLERVRELVPFLRGNARRTELERRVPEENIDALVDAGVFRLAKPRSRGGLEATIGQQNEILSEIARGCPSTSWVATISTASYWLVALLPDSGQDEIYGSSDGPMSGVFAPTAAGVRVDGGIILNGHWGFNTGCRNAKWGGFSAIVASEDGSMVPHYVAMPYSELSIADDWNAMGMSGTGSCTVTATDVFVPDRRLMSLPAMMTGGSQSTEAKANSYYRRPAVPVLMAVSAGTPWGIAKGALDVFLDRLPGRAITYSDYTNQTLAPITHLQRADVELTMVSLEAHVARFTELVDGGAACGPDMVARAAVRAHTGHVAKLSREIVEVLFQASGASSIQYDVAIQRYHRDMQALSIHAFFQHTTSDELYGRLLLGLAPNTTFI